LQPPLLLQVLQLHLCLHFALLLLLDWTATAREHPSHEGRVCWHLRPQICRLEEGGNSEKHAASPDSCTLVAAVFLGAR
jgi:hypothetical protein